MNRIQLQDAIDEAIEANDIVGEAADKLRRVGREAEVVVVGDYFDTDGNLCPASQAYPTESKVPQSDALFGFATSFDKIMRPLVGHGTHIVSGPTREQRDVRLMWADTVEKTKRPQVQGMLADSDTGGRCCLGVLADLAVTMGVIDGYEESIGMPNSKVTSMVGLTTYSQDVRSSPDPNAAVTYAAMNDRGKTFKQIAKAIRESVDS